jgi:hypothetical protein
MGPELRTPGGDWTPEKTVNKKTGVENEKVIRLFVGITGGVVPDKR